MRDLAQHSPLGGLAGRAAEVAVAVGARDPRRRLVQQIRLLRELHAGVLGLGHDVLVGDRQAQQAVVRANAQRDGERSGVEVDLRREHELVRREDELGQVAVDAADERAETDAQLEALLHAQRVLGHERDGGAVDEGRGDGHNGRATQHGPSVGVFAREEEVRAGHEHQHGQLAQEAAHDARRVQRPRHEHHDERQRGQIGVHEGGRERELDVEVGEERLPVVHGLRERREGEEVTHAHEREEHAGRRFLTLLLLTAEAAELVASRVVGLQVVGHGGALGHRRSGWQRRQHLDGDSRMAWARLKARTELSEKSVPTTARALRSLTLKLSTDASPSKKQQSFAAALPDQYETFDELQSALRRQGVESSNLILGVDFTQSNEWTGKVSFGGRCLHKLDPVMLNPYQRVISIIGRTLTPFDDDNLIPAFGFGDSRTGCKAVFPFYEDGQPCAGFADVLQRYERLTPQLVLSGQTNFAPVIDAAIALVQETQSYHILVIIADGQVNNDRETSQAIIRASHYALSIIVVGVGDGPWDLMDHYDDTLVGRKFDNFQFVDFHRVMKSSFRNPEVGFATAALMEIPDQFRIIRRLGYLKF